MIFALVSLVLIVLITVDTIRKDQGNSLSTDVARALASITAQAVSTAQAVVPTAKRSLAVLLIVVTTAVHNWPKLSSRRTKLRINAG